MVSNADAVKTASFRAAGIQPLLLSCTGARKLLCTGMHS